MSDHDLYSDFLCSFNQFPRRDISLALRDKTLALAVYSPPRRMRLLKKFQFDNTSVQKIFPAFS